MQLANWLDVYCGDLVVGTLYNATPLAFEYAPAWLKRDPPMPVAAIPLAPGQNDSPAVEAFFENLLPEGDLRQSLAVQRKAPSVFSLLREVAGDTAGGFVILPGGLPPRIPAYEATAWDALAVRLNVTPGPAMSLAGQGTRISLAGAQNKVCLAIFPDGIPRLPLGSTASTHILKRDVRRSPAGGHSGAIEAIVMLAAANCGLPVADVFYEPHTRGCVVRRFDRAVNADGTVRRLTQYDFCQLSGTVSARKYEKDGGPGIAACADLIRACSVQPAVDLRAFVSWVLFNLCIGNKAGHAKALSMLEAPGGGFTLAPFYGLTCTRLRPGLAGELAMAVGGESRPDAITRANLDAMAGALRMRPQFIARLLTELAEALPPALEAAVRIVSPELPRSAKGMAARLKDLMLASTARLASAISR